MIKQLAHLCIHSANLKRNHDFYCQALGLQVAFEFERDGAPFGYYYKVGQGTYIEVFEGEAAEPGNIKHMALEVEDLDGVIERVRAHGHEVTDKKLGADQTWQAWTADPDGVRIEFHEYTEKSSQRTGEKCVF